MSIQLTRGGTWSFEQDGFELNRIGVGILLEDRRLSNGDTDCNPESVDACTVRYSWVSCPGLHADIRVRHTQGNSLEIQGELRNGTCADIFLRTFTPLSYKGGGGDLFKVRSSTAQLHTFPAERSYGSEGPQALDGCRPLTSFWQVAMYDASSGKAFSAGVSGVPQGLVRFRATPFLAEREPGLRYIQWSCEVDCHSGLRGVRIPRDGSFETGAITVRIRRDIPDDAGLLQFLREDSASLEWARRPLPGWCRGKVPAGWCSWYAGYYDAIDEESMLREVAEASGIPGIGVFQLDDGWADPATGTRRLGKPLVDDVKFPHGLEPVFHSISERGMVPGLWLRPFWGWKDIPGEERPAWAVGQGLDLSHPGARAWLEGLGRWVRDTGIGYVKLDFLTWDLYGKWGMEMGEPQGIPYKPHDDSLTDIQAYGMGLEAFRRGAGDGVFILGCNCLSGPALGIIDANRIGDDVNAGNWERVLRMGVIPITMMQSSLMPYVKDPDCAMAQEPLTLGQARAWLSLIGMSGQLFMLSTKLYGLDVERRKLVKSILPLPSPFESHSVEGLGTDADTGVWEALPPGDERGALKRRVIGLFNWSSEARVVKFPMFQIPTLVREFWTGEIRYIPEGSESGVTIPSGDCRVFVTCLPGDHPFVLGTDRHLFQGIVEISDTVWNGETGTLSIYPTPSSFIGGEAFTAYICAPSDWVPVSPEFPTIAKAGSYTIRSVGVKPGEVRITNWVRVLRP